VLARGKERGKKKKRAEVYCKRITPPFPKNARDLEVRDRQERREKERRERRDDKYSLVHSFCTSIQIARGENVEVMRVIWQVWERAEKKKEKEERLRQHLRRLQ